MDRQVHIYTLSNPVTGEVRYVGKTVKQLYSRLSSHINAAPKSSTHSARWINGLLILGIKPEINLIESVNESDWELNEAYWIEQFKQWGFNLTNICSGGIGASGYKRTPAIETPCIQYDLNGKEVGRYKSMTVAAKQLNLDCGSISECCRKRLNTYRGYIFRKETEPLTKEDLAKTLDRSNNKKRTAVYSIDKSNNKIYHRSAKEASDYTGACASYILKCCKQTHRMSNGYKFIFA